MKAYVTKITHITSKKDGKQYVKLNLVLDNGDTDSCFFALDRFEQFHIDLDTPDLANLAGVLPELGVSYNQRGKIDTLRQEE